jgi:hypothetical protein
MIRFKTISKFCEESGYTDAAVRGKIREGIWMERKVWRKAPDGHVLIDVEGYNEWVVNGGGLACNLPLKPRSKLNARARLGATEDALGLSPAPLK